MKAVHNRVKGGLCALVLILMACFTVGFCRPMEVMANDAIPGAYYFDARQGQVNTHGENGIYGYTTAYICGGGEKKTEHAVENTWHITSYASYYAYGVTWYQCWDTDDGDYYGWIDGAYLDFYTASPQVSVAVTEIEDRRGQVNTHGGSVDGYTTAYVCNGAEKQIEHPVQNTWHITARATCYAYGVTWYQCWDTDDGDYYGWIDAAFLDFYDTVPPVVTSIVVETVLVTEAPPPTETVVVEKTVVVTEYVTEATTTTVTAVAAMAEPTDTSPSDGEDASMSGTILIVLIAAAILLLMMIAILLIVLYTRKGKSTVPVGQVQQTAPLYCSKCGAPRVQSDDLYCEQCGTPYNQ